MFNNSSGNFFSNLPAFEVDSPTLIQPGDYTLLIEGSMLATSTGSYSFNVQPVVITTAALTTGATG